MKTTLFKSLSSSWNSIATYFESEETKAQKNPLYGSFSLYLSEDLKMAFELLKKGYEPSFQQKHNFHQNLIKHAAKDVNFLFKYQLYTDFIPGEAIVAYCLHQDLSHKCKNDATVFDNYKHLFKKFSQQENFSTPLYEAMKKSITAKGMKLAQMNPKYEHTHTFDLNEHELKIRDLYTHNIYNCLVLLPFMIEHLDQFVALKSAIERTVVAIETNLQKHNVRVCYDGYNTVHSHANNRVEFKVKTLNSWKDYLNKYDTNYLQQKLMSNLNPDIITDSKLVTEQLNVEKTKNIFQQKDDLTFIKINNLKNNLNETHKTQIQLINNLYSQIKCENLNINETYDLESMYKDVPHVIEKFISIDPHYRDKLKSIEGKSPEQIMVESLSVIEEKFKNHLENINQMKVSDLSVVGRTIKMKA